MEDIDDGEADDILNEEDSNNMPETKPEENFQEKQKETPEPHVKIEKEETKDENVEDMLNKEDTKNKYVSENEYDLVSSAFPKIKLPNIDPKIEKKRFTEDEWKNYGSYNFFFCDSDKCGIGKGICASCMKLTQKLLSLKPHYLVNSVGRLCTYKRGKIYCNTKLTREVILDNGIRYIYSFRCGHSGQCSQCRMLTDNINTYFDSKLMEKLKKRDNKN